LAFSPFWLLPLIALVVNQLGASLFQANPGIQENLIFKALFFWVIGPFLSGYFFPIALTLAVDAVIISFVGVCLSYVPSLRSRKNFVLVALIVGFLPLIPNLYVDSTPFWSMFDHFALIGGVLALVAYFFAPYKLDDSAMPLKKSTMQSP
jgi:hypothetical protein